MTLSSDKMSVNDAVSVVGAVELKQNPTPSQSAEDRYQIRDKRSGRAKKKIYIEYSEKQYFKIYNTNQEGSRTSLGSAGDQYSSCKFRFKCIERRTIKGFSHPRGQEAEKKQIKGLPSNSVMPSCQKR